MPASPTQGIGVLSSISFSGTGLADAFLKGLGREVYLNVKDNRGYDAKSLNEALQALNNDIRIGLIDMRQFVQDCRLAADHPPRRKFQYAAAALPGRHQRPRNLVIIGDQHVQP